MNREEEKNLKELNEENKIIILQCLWLNKGWKIKYSNNEYESRDFNLIDFQENLQYLVNLKELKISNNNDIKILNLKKCINIKNLCLGNNKIVKIELPIQNKFEHLSIYNNPELKEINLEVLNPEYLKDLTLSSNNKLKLKTEMLNKFTNLEELYITNSNCSGSLIHFRNLTKLKNLWINNTSIIPSFEYLPNNASIYLYSIFPSDSRQINNFLTIKNNVLLGRDMEPHEEFISISEFKAKHPILIKNIKEIIQIYNYLIEINKDKAQLDNYLLKEKENGIKFKAETESEKTKYFYSNYSRFIMIYELFSKWIYDENKYLNKKSNASLAYYVELLRNKEREKSPNLTNEEVQKTQESIEYFPLI